ncbi:MAG: hypothetical protein IID44_04360 [Planctomycetes bacterium]|nr:hypothetical protein [Planctomycetota bacterium]
MPSIRTTGSKVSLAIFDVVGQDGDEVGFIDHTGLAESAGSQHTGRIPVLDMGPPLHGQGSPNHIIANVVGSATLTDAEEQKIRTFVDRHASEHLIFQQLTGLPLLRLAPQMFCVHPHASPLNEDDGRYVRMRFSCAGFVVEAYKKARIRLLDPSALPMVDIEIIRVGYPLQARLMDHDKISPEDLGLRGSGPWPVLLCGYLFHALDRGTDAIRNGPFAPDVAHRHFS